MKLSKAIETSSNLPLDDEHIFTPEQAKSIRMLIEAGERVKGNRKYPQPTVYPLLPGETEE